MGDPKKHRKKYSTPIHPWQKERIEEEKKLMSTYGLKNKQEIWKMVSKLRGFSRQAKNLIARTTPQGQKEKQQLLAKLHSWNLLSSDADLDDVLGLTTKDIMERRIQTIVFRKGLATSLKQARQFIVHRHILIGEKKITIPSYIVKGNEEAKICFVPTSNLSKIEVKAESKKVET